MTQSAKEFFLNDVEDLIGEYLTGANTKRVINDIDSQLIGYNLEAIHTDYSPENDDVVAMFLNAKATEGRSPGTIDRYRRELYKLCRAVGKPALKISTEDIRDFIAKEQARGISSSTMNGVRSCYSSFFNWIWREGLIRISPTGNIGAIKYIDKVRLPYTDTELEQIKTACAGTRDLAIVYFLLTTGCRVHEATNMNIDDVNFKSLECKVLGKGNKERIVYLTPVSSMILQRYIAGRSDSLDALFISQKGRLTTGGMRDILKRLERKSGVVNVHPHRFRRTLATNLLNRGMPIQEVAKILGHANINTTMKYFYADKANVKHNFQRYV